MLEAIKNLDISGALELLNTGVCVKECPTASTDEDVECVATQRMTNDNANFEGGCVYMIGLTYLETFLPEEAIKAYVDKFYTDGYDSYKARSDAGTAPKIPFRYNTSKMYGFCLPELNTDKASAFSKDTYETFKKLFTETVMNDKMTSYIADIATAWKVIAVCAATSLVLAYLYLFLVKCIGGLIVWASIAAIQISLIGGGAYCFVQSGNYDEDHDYYTWLKYAAYVIWGVGALFLCCICCCWTAIRIGIAVYKTTAQYIASNLRIFLIPFVTYIVCIVWLAAWLISFIFVFSIGEPTAREAPYQFITEMKWDSNTRYMVIYQLFMLFWVNAWVMGMCQFVIACSACIWYFEVNSDTGGSGTVGRAIKWGFRYHMGSVAFGAAVIAICQLIRTLFEYYRRKIQAATKNACVRCLLCYTSYLLWALEKCIKFITKNAYIQVALSNTFFCKAAWNAFALILKNVHRFGWLNTIGFILNWFGICAIAFLNAFGAYIAITKIEAY